MAGRRKIIVVGGGVVGLTTALILSSKYDVSVVGEHIGKLSDSRKATAIWHVYLVPETPQILSWAQKSLEKLYELAVSEPAAGVELVRGVELFRNSKSHVPSWSHIPKLFRVLTEQEIANYNNFPVYDLTGEEISLLRQNPVIWGYHIEAPAASMEIYLSWLESNLRDRGVHIANMRLDSLNALASECQVIVNCSGFGARELVKDTGFIPYKGQYFVLKASETSPRNYIGDDDHPCGMAYMIPRLGEVMIGGCAEEGREDLELSLDWADTIRRAGLFVPWLHSCSPENQARAPVVGIRPCRTSGVRLEVDCVSASIPIIHNYGHGGSGFSLSWGCAKAVASFVQNL